MAGVAGSQPTNLSSEVPAQDAAQSSAAQIADSKSVTMPTPAPTPEAPAEAPPIDLAQFMKPQAEADPLDQFMKQPEESTFDKYGKPIIKALDYPGGLVRTAGAAAIGGLAEAAGQGKQPVTGADVKQALQGNAPTSAQYLEKGGLSEGPSFNIPGMGHMSLRDVEGFGLDIASDPLTAVTKLVKEVPYIGKLINAPGAAAEWLGDKTYKAAFSKVDNALAKKGVTHVSDIMKEAGMPTGTGAGLQAKAAEMADDMGSLRQTMYDKANSMGTTIDLGNPKLTTRTDALLAKMKTDPGLRPQAIELEDMLNRYKANGPASIDAVSSWKTSLYNSLPSSAFNGFGKAKTTAVQFRAALAADMRDAIGKAGNFTEKGLGDAINALNDKWGVLIEAKKPLAQLASENASSLGHQIDATLLGSGHVQTYVAKKAFDLADSPLAKSVVGKALSSAGRNGFVDAAARRAAIDANTPEALKPTPQE